MTTKEDRLLQWLRDAHAMEKQAEAMLSAQASRIVSYPELKQKIEEHLAETKRQADMLQSCIERRGGDTSTLKDLMGRFAAMGQGLGGAVMDDEVIKGSMASYTFEHMEIAAYEVLIATAEACGDVETVAVCQRILNEETAMATWLGENLGAVTQKFLSLDEREDASAKR
ncbi:ferritin-like domain-containing protein [Bosea robiniae]|uniref:Ferritin-like metal-binding protein YciE n=1 Tax=Bosea robiniae TaxID=1036780 RepID=A0ABY0PAA6_9HYPH|nr:ferritin-like domain-containing protein [Bosea robiniae]SDH79685.1 Ferritin-like metal-binding protein YciE [Bosea robiniae]